MTDTHVHEITQNSGAPPALQCDTLQSKKSQGRDGRASPAPGPTLTPVMMHLCLNYFILLSPRTSTPPGDVHLHPATSSSSLGQTQRLQEQNVQPQALQGHLQPPTNPSLLLFQALRGKKAQSRGLICGCHPSPANGTAAEEHLFLERVFSVSNSQSFAFSFFPLFSP